MNILLAIIGGLFRRAWGGWIPMRHWLKILIVFALATLSGFLHTGNLFAAPAYGFVITLAFLNTFHGEGMVQGWKPALIMAGTYGFYTLCAAFAVWAITGNILYATAFNGFLTPIAYQLAWKYKTKIPQIKVFGRDFITEPTTIGELFLGALLLG